MRRRQADPALLAAGLVLITVCCVLCIVLSFFRWYSDGGAGALEVPDPGGGTWSRAGAALVCLPVLFTAWLRSGDLRCVSGTQLAGRITLPALSAAAFALALWNLNWLSPAWPVTSAGLIALGGFTGLMSGVLVLSLVPLRCLGEAGSSDNAPVSKGLASLFTVTAAAVLAGGVAGGTAAVSAIDVTSDSTAAPLPAAPGGPPAHLNTVSWHVRLPDNDTLLADSGRYLVISTGDGIQVRDAETGASRWEYRRRADRYTLVAAPLTADGSDIEAVYARDREQSAPADTVVVGLDTVTGQVRWQWSSPVDPGSQSLDTPKWTITGGTLIDDVPDTQSGPFGVAILAIGFDPRTGALRWRARSPHDDCVPFIDHPAVMANGMLTIGLECERSGPGGEAQDLVLGYSAATGRQAWSRNWGDRFSSMSFQTAPGILAVNTGTGTPTLTLLAAGTGATLGSIPGNEDADTIPGSGPPRVLQTGSDPSSSTVEALSPGLKPLWKATLTWPDAADPADGDMVTRGDPRAAAESSGNTYVVGWNPDGGPAVVFRVGPDGDHAKSPALPGIHIAATGMRQVLTAPRVLVIQAETLGPGTDLYGIE